MCKSFFSFHAKTSDLFMLSGRQENYRYDNTPTQYTVIFHSCKNGNFQMKNCDIFLIFAQNIECGYT